MAWLNFMSTRSIVPGVSALVSRKIVVCVRKITGLPLSSNLSWR